MTSVSFVVPGRPVPYARPAQAGKRRYAETASAAYMRAVGTYATLAMRGRPRFAGEVRVEAEFHVPERAAARADVDNLAKAALDGLSGIVIADDRLVVELLACKRRAATAADERTVITVTPLEPCP